MVYPSYLRYLLTQLPFIALPAVGPPLEPKPNEAKISKH